MTRKILVLPVCFVLLSCDMSKEQQRVAIILTVIGVVIVALASGSRTSSKTASTGSCPTPSTSDVTLEHTHSGSTHSHSSEIYIDSGFLHSGRTNGAGCHTNRSTGVYHCDHNSAPAPTPRPAPAPTPSISAPAC